MAEETKQPDFVKCFEQPPECRSGTLMVTRNPCCHPGDIRLVNAVDERILLSRL